MAEHRSAWGRAHQASWPRRQAGEYLIRCERSYAAEQRRALLTGMSGSGKSSVILALADLGYKSIDTDDGWCDQLPDGRQRWREDAIATMPLSDLVRAVLRFVGECRAARADRGKRQTRG